MLSKNWKLSDEEFNGMKAIFEQKSPELRTPQAIRTDIAHMDRGIDTNLMEKKQDWQTAICILLQGRNFLARYVGDEERAVPDSCCKTEEAKTVDPLEAKHVALYAPLPSIGPAAMAALQMTVRTDARYKLYMQSRDLLQAIVAGDVCGIIALHGIRGGSALATLRHDYKNLPGHTEDEAQSYLFPPCVDLQAPHGLVAIIRLLSQMQSGTYQATDEFDLDRALPALSVHMRCPQRDLSVTIMDDEDEMMEGMVRVLQVWPRIRVSRMHQKRSMPNIPVFVDIVLLDEALDGVSGTDVHEELLSHNFRGIAASTSGGACPTWCTANRHFQQKDRVATSCAVALEFIRFMNKLIEAAS